MPPPSLPLPPAPLPLPLPPPPPPPGDASELGLSAHQRHRLLVRLRFARLYLEQLDDSRRSLLCIDIAGALGTSARCVAFESAMRWSGKRWRLIVTVRVASDDEDLLDEIAATGE